MSAFLNTFHEHPLAAAFGALGLACQLAWPLFRMRRAMLAVQFGVGADYAVQYALLGAWSGAGVAALGAAQTAVALLTGDSRSLRWVGALFLPVVAAICVATWSGPASLMALTACALIMIGRMQRDTLRLRLFLLGAAPFGIGHDIVVGAAPALLGAVASACVAAVMLARELARRRRDSGDSNAALAYAASN